MADTSPSRSVELVLLCQKYASKLVFYSYFMVLSGGKFLDKDLFDSLNEGNEHLDLYLLASIMKYHVELHCFSTSYMGR
jgi:hypothetical protein